MPVQTETAKATATTTLLKRPPQTEIREIIHIFQSKKNYYLQLKRKKNSNKLPKHYCRAKPRQQKTNGRYNQKAKKRNREAHIQSRHEKRMTNLRGSAMGESSNTQRELEARHGEEPWHSQHHQHSLKDLHSSRDFHQTVFAHRGATSTSLRTN
jgi:hypothetical protein